MTWRPRLAAAWFALLLASNPAVAAQRLLSASITTAGTDCTTATACAVLAQDEVFQSFDVAIQLAGTWTGTAQFEATADGTNWVAVSMTPYASATTVTSSTSNGAWTVVPGVLQGIRVRASTLSSGTITVSIIVR